VGENVGGDKASAAEFFGNGETTNRIFFESLQMRILPRNAGTPPRSIVVSGDWNEVWTLEADNVHEGYTRPPELRRVEVCGRHFLQYEAIDRPSSSGGKNGFGVRCLAKTSGRAPAQGFYRGLWYGEGQWNGGFYAHLGFLHGLRRELTAADICEPSISGCGGKVPPGDIRHTYFGHDSGIPARYIKVEGLWSEDWVLNDVNPRPAPR